MAALLDTIEGETIPEHRPWPRLVVNEDGWRFAASRLSAGSWTLLGLWGDIGGVQMAVLDEGARGIAVVTIPCPDGRFPSIGAVHHPAIRLERAVRDLYGLEPVGCPDTRPWLDLGFWDVQHPLGERRNAAAGRVPYAFMPTAGEGLHQIPVGPVHAGIIEPGHFRFTANGETVARLEQRLGYVHKGIEDLMARATLDKAAKLAGRTSARNADTSGTQLGWRSSAVPPGTTASIISRCPKQKSAMRNVRSRRMPQRACMIANDASLQMAPISPK